MEREDVQVAPLITRGWGVHSGIESRGKGRAYIWNEQSVYEVIESSGTAIDGTGVMHFSSTTHSHQHTPSRSSSRQEDLSRIFPAHATVEKLWKCTCSRINQPVG